MNSTKGGTVMFLDPFDPYDRAVWRGIVWGLGLAFVYCLVLALFFAWFL